MNQKPNSEIENPRTSPRWTSVAQFGLSLMGAFMFWGLALTMGLMVLSAAFRAPGFGLAPDGLPLLLMASGLALGGLLLLPSAGYALLDILNRPNPLKLRLRRPGLLIFLLPPLLVAGFYLSQSPGLAVIALPPLHAVAIGVSVLWLISLSLRGLSVGSDQRAWGVFGAGLVAAPLLSLIAEVILVVLVGILGLSYLTQDPKLASELSRLSERIIINPEMPPDEIFRLLEPFLLQPVTLYFGLIFGAILVPLVEEIFKPVGVWLLVDREPTPVQGFAAGVLSGAGFALFENFTLSASSGEEWSFVVLARVGTSMIHVLTTGLMGWALANAWRERKYVRLGLTYFLSVAIHALWNGLVILTIIPEIMPEGMAYPQFLRNIAAGAPVGFVVILVGGFMTLLGCNLALRRVAVCLNEV